MESRYSAYRREFRRHPFLPLLLANLSPPILRPSLPAAMANRIAGDSKWIAPTRPRSMPPQAPKLESWTLSPAQKGKRGEAEWQAPTIQQR
jgi:hypothetical protein